MWQLVLREENVVQYYKVVCELADMKVCYNLQRSSDVIDLNSLIDIGFECQIWNVFLVFFYQLQLQKLQETWNSKSFFWKCFEASLVILFSWSSASAEACNELMAYSLILSCCCYTCCIRRKLRKTLNITVIPIFLLHGYDIFLWVSIVYRNMLIEWWTSLVFVCISCNNRMK